MQRVSKQNLYKVAVITFVVIAILCLALVAGIDFKQDKIIASAEELNFQSDLGFGQWRGFSGSGFSNYGEYLSVSIDENYIVEFASNTSFCEYTKDYEIEILICSGNIGSYIFQANRSLIYSGTDKFGTSPTKSYNLKNKILAVGLTPRTYSISVVLYNPETNKYMKQNPDTTLFTYTAPTVPLPPDPVKPGHTFVGWFYDEELTDPYIAGDPIYEDTELYAKFEINIYSVVVKGFDSISLVNDEYDYESVVSFVAPEITGHVFKGWYTDSAKTQLYSEDVALDITVTENLTLYADYEVIMFTVTFIVDAVVYAEIEVPYGATLVSTEEGEALMANLSFVSKSPLMLTAFNVNNEVITQDITLYAQLAETDDNIVNFLKGNWRVLSGAAGGLILLAIVIAVINKSLRRKKRK